jgi:F-type H+-transporting ATPase subunit epsilon
MSDGLPATLHLKVVTPRRLVVEADADSVALPGLEGELGILPGHRPLFAALGRGRITYRSGSLEESFAVRGGYAQVQPEKVLVMTEDAEDEGPDPSAA